MSRLGKGCIIVGALIILCVAALLVVNRFPVIEEEGHLLTEETKPAQLLMKDIDQLERAEISWREGGGYTIERDESGNFTIPELGEIPVVQDSFLQYGGYTTFVIGDMVVNDHPDDLSVYGLDDPVVDTTMTFQDGTVFRVKLGNDAPLGMGTYIQVQDDPTVYMLSTTTADAFKLKPAYFVDPNILPAAEHVNESVLDMQQTSTFDYVELSGGVRTETLRFEPFPADSDDVQAILSPYYMSLPRHQYINYETSGYLFDYLWDLTANDVVSVFPTEEELAAYDFENPQAVLRVGINGEEYTLTVAGYSDDCYYVRKDGLDVIYRVGVSKMPWVTDTTYRRMVTPLLYYTNIVETANITVEGRGKTYSFDVQPSGNTYVAVYNGQAYDSGEFLVWCTLLMSSYWDDYTETPPPADTPAELTITFTSNVEGKEDTVVEFVPYNGRQYAIRINGAAEFLIRWDFVEAIFEQTERFVNGEPANSVWQ